MANRYANLPGSSKIKDTYNRINQGFDAVEQDIDKLQSDLDQEIADREQAVDAVDERVDQIIQGGGEDKDAELVDIRTPDASYTPNRTINVAGDLTRDMQAQFMSHKAEKASVTNVHNIASTQSVTYYLDEQNGDDSNDGLSEGNAFATWGKVQSLIPRFLQHSLIVRIIGDYTGNIYIDPFVSGTAGINSYPLHIVGDTEDAENHTISGLVQPMGCRGGVTWNEDVPCAVLFRYITFAGDVSCRASDVYFRDCEFDMSDTLSFYGGKSMVRSCDFGDHVAATCIRARALAHVFSRSNTGSGTLYGLRADEGSVIAKRGSQPTGDTSDEYSEYGGVIR